MQHTGPVDPLVRAEPPSEWYRTPSESRPRVETAAQLPDLDPDIALWPVTPLSRWPFAGAPSVGVWPKGWMGVDNTGTIYVCTVGGAPGTWVAQGGGGGGSGLPAPNLAVGAGGGFGVEITGNQTLSGITSPNWDAAWTLESNTPVTTAVDNSYMAWDPTDPSHFTIKQSGWYVQSWEWALSAAADGNYTVVPGDASVGSGPGIFLIPGGAGSDTFQDASALVYIPPSATDVLFQPIDFNKFGATDLTLTDCQIVFIPLFALA